MIYLISWQAVHFTVFSFDASPRSYLNLSVSKECNTKRSLSMVEIYPRKENKNWKLTQLRCSVMETKNNTSLSCTAEKIFLPLYMQNFLPLHSQYAILLHISLQEIYYIY